MNRIRNVLSNWGAFVFNVAVSFFLAPFVVHSLGDSAYGIWVLLGSLVGYLGLLDLGVRGAVTRYVARYQARDEHDEATQITSSALAVFTALGLLAIVASIGLAIVIDDLFEIPRRLVGAARIVMILSGVNMAVSILAGVFGGIVIGLQRFDLKNVLEVVIGAVRAVSIVVALGAGYGLVALALIQLAVSSVRGVVNYWLSRRLYPELRVTYRESRWSHLSTIFSYSASVVLLQASTMVILFTDSVVIGAFLPVGMITFFAIASSLTEYARAPVSGISTTVTPWVSSLEGQGKDDALQGVLLSNARIAGLVVLPILVTFMVRGESFIFLWMGPEYAERAGHVLWILSLALSFAVAYQIVATTMMGLSKHGGLVPAFFLEAACNLGLSILWVVPYGIVGVAWGTTVPRLVGSILFAPWYVRRVMGTPMWTFWLEAWVRPAAAMLPFVAGSYAIELWWPVSNLVLYFVQVALVLPLALLGAWTISLEPAEKRRVVESGLVRRLLRRDQSRT